MLLLAAVDERNGLLFNRRRQSRDRVVTQRVLALSAGKTLWMRPYSAKLFAGDAAPQIRVDENPLEKAGVGEFCFLESGGVMSFADKLERVYLFRWNRRYPADTYLDLDLSGPGWRLAGREEFPGYSHEKITMEVYDHA